jgi:hypothetical protein
MEEENEKIRHSNMELITTDSVSIKYHNQNN